MATNLLASIGYVWLTCWCVRLYPPFERPSRYEYRPSSIGASFVAPEPRTGQSHLEYVEEYESELLKYQNLKDDHLDDSAGRAIVNIDQCVFEDNSCPQDDFPLDIYGAIQIVSSNQDTSITQTVFRNNVFVDCDAALVSCFLCGMLVFQPHSGFAF